jgi:TRAP-type C4-dicarboxylate transport system substrate-binding protein
MRKVRWVLAHEPIELFLRAAVKFVKELNVTMPGEMDFEIMTLSEYGDTYHNGKKITKHDLLDLMEAGELEMSQMYTVWLAERFSKDMNVLDMPFLFRDHAHAARVLDGEIGMELLNSLSADSNVKGLAFTYSGGYRMIPANKPVNKVEDFRGLKVRSNRSPVAIDILKAVGAEPIVMELEAITGAVKEGKIVGGESTYPRFYALKQNEVCEYINDTKHSLFLTSIIVNTEFWNSLTPEQQDKIQTAAQNAARYERAISVSDIEMVQEKCREDQIDVIDLSEEEVAKFKEMTKSVYDKYENYFSNDLIGRISRQ